MDLKKLTKLLRKPYLISKRWLQKRIDKITLPDYTVFSIFAIITGIVVGFAAVFFHDSITFFNKVFFNQTTSGLFFLGTAAVVAIPALGMLIQAIMIILSPNVARHKGVSEVIKAVAIRGGHIPLRTTIFHFIAPVISIGSGNTVGPEGPAAQIGGGLASKLASLFKLSDSRKRIFTAAGAGAAIAAIFNTPMGGIFFALEVVLLNDFQTATFSALILSSVTASTISRIFLGNKSVFNFVSPSIGSYQNLYLYAILGILAGLISLAFIRYSDMLDKFIRKKLIKIFPQWILMTFVGLLMGISGYFYKDIFGIGYIGINHILAQLLTWKVVLVLLVLKFILVPLILNTGGFGGTFAPSLFMGACVGYLFALALNYFWGFGVDTTAFILVGMGAILGGANSIPISAILIIFEMTKDYSFIIPLMIAVVASTMIVQISLKGSVHVKHLEDQGYRLAIGRQHSILRNKHVNELMRKDVVLIPENTPLSSIVVKLMNLPHSTFYVVDNKDNIVGIITETELRPIITEYEHIREVLVARDIANSNFVTVYETDNLDHVMKIFESKDIDELPVVSSSNPTKIIGTIWRQDVIAAYNKESLKYNVADSFASELRSIDKIGISKVADGYSIIEKKVNHNFVGKTLAQLKLRNNYGLEVLMIKHSPSAFDSIEEQPELIVPDPNYVIKDDDVLVLFGADDKIAKTNDWK
ncbi:chloride channel protein [Melioribacteraceae bacterium 4301-Me]|uniref:chloride channel protein n=1 Tax=Pyranulibacter aquaticus TaxID=3163344 RepID=UPI003598C86A